ncbi:MAG: hypothetical protein CME71_10165 [Halobacteriovorax sp.]|nr:hypothetical protein [Halobacteriovorax sp.]
MLAVVDCNAFYCNCERLFRPDLKNTPIVVLSNNDGCVISRTPEAKKFDIAMGVPYHHISKLCREKKIAVFSSNFALYTNLSHRVMSVLKSITSRVEVYSVDEAFIDLSGARDFFHEGQYIKAEVERLVGIPVSIGIAPTKTLAKMAVEMAKKSHFGVISLDTKKKQLDALKGLPVSAVWGVGHGRQLRLQSIGIKTATDLMNYKNPLLLRKNLTKLGEQIQDELNGIQCFPLGERTEKKKSISSTRTFSQASYDKIVVSQAIATHASDVACELRMQGSVCKKIAIMIRSNPFQSFHEQYNGMLAANLLTPTSNTFELIKIAFELLDEMWKHGISIHKAGVFALDIQDEHEHEVDLFAPIIDPRQAELMRTIDCINDREGPRMVRSAACGTDNKAWAMRQNMLSPRYTTSWIDLPMVR